MPRTMTTPAALARQLAQQLADAAIPYETMRLAALRISIHQQARILQAMGRRHTVLTAQQHLMAKVCIRALRARAQVHIRQLRQWRDTDTLTLTP